MPGGRREWCLAPQIRFIGIDVVPGQEHPYDLLVPTLGSPKERSLIPPIRSVGADVVSLEQNPYDPVMPILSG